MAFIRPDGNDNELNRPAEVAGARPRGWYRGDASDNPGTILRAPDVNEALGNNRELVRYAGIDLSARTAPDDTILRDAVIAAAARGMFFKRAADPTGGDVSYEENGLQLAYPVGSRWYNTTERSRWLLVDNDGVSAGWERESLSQSEVLWSGSVGYLQQTSPIQNLNTGKRFSDYTFLSARFSIGGSRWIPGASPVIIFTNDFISGDRWGAAGVENGGELDSAGFTNLTYNTDDSFYTQVIEGYADSNPSLREIKGIR